MKQSLLLLLSVAAGAQIASAADAKPKYGPEAVLLSGSHAHIQKSPAPDYWALSPYYLAQQDDRSCSVASVATVVNAARVGRKLTSEDELATQSGLLKRVKSDVWTKGVGDGGHGVSLDELAPIIEASLNAYGVKDFTLETFHADDTKAFKERLHKALVENEKTADDFIVLNFLQSVYTADADAGHIATLGAYDAKARRALVLDPDRQWYEPYWVSEETLLKGMNTKDKTSGKTRGFIWLKLAKK